MNNLWTDTGYISLNHVNEQLCGDRVEIIGNNEKSLTMVLADGLGSGVKANILSTLTSKIICTMMANGMPIEERKGRNILRLCHQQYAQCHFCAG